MNTLAHDIPSLRDKVSPEEWAVRADLAACYRLVAHYGWEDLVFTHITAPVPASEGPAWRDSGKRRLVAGLGDKTSLILRNHGLLTVGETVAEAFVAMYYLEASCAIQVRAQSGGGELIPVPKEIIETAYAQVMAAARPRGSRGTLVWPGLLRRLDRVDPSYRT